MESEKDSKEYQSFKKNLHVQLKEFQKCRQWADINKWLHYLQTFLQNKQFAILPHAITLGKRLAQCLAPTLPSGVHTAALKVYVLILTNFQDKQNLLPLMSIGLFPFFQYSSSQLKLDLLKIYEIHFLSDSGSLQMTISLMNALLTGLNQNNQDLIKKIFLLTDKINKKYGYIWIDGAVWVNILKSNKVKIPGFKYFMKVFKDRDREKLRDDKEDQQDKLQKHQKHQKIDKIEKLDKVEKIDKIDNKNIDNSIKQKKSSTRSKKASSHSIKVKRNYLKQQQMRFLERIYQQKQIPDGPHNRFPNFSVLVVNAIRSCLEPQMDSLAKRAALQHVATYLKLSQREIVSQQDALILVTSMLRVLTLKQFSLTRRIYLYLFDQPNSQGQYHIDAEERGYQLEILVFSIRHMMKEHMIVLMPGQSLLSVTQKNNKNIQTILSIIEILILDHPKLSALILPQLSYEILKFLKVTCFSSNYIVRQLKKKIVQFNQNVISSNRMIFLQAILSKVQKKQIKQKDLQSMEQQFSNNPQIQSQLLQVISILDFYIYTLYKTKYNSSSVQKSSLKKSSSSNQLQQSQLQKQISQQLRQICLTTITKILYFLQASHLTYQKLSNQALDFANKLYKQTLSEMKSFQFHQDLVRRIDDLIQLGPGQSVYSRLLRLHPKPRKQILLPYINEGAFALVCIQNLLPKNNTQIQLTQQQQNQLFFAIFRLLQCHLWQQQTFQFIKIFIQKYPITFYELIDKTDPSKWLIYWRLAQGDVKGGVIRMIQSAQSQNPLKKHMSCKWIQANQQRISKVIDPIYFKLRQWELTFRNNQIDGIDIQKEINSIFNLIKIVFQTSKQTFARFFFLQSDKYLVSLLDLIFLNLQKGSQKLKTKSMQMMKFLLLQCQTYQQKYNFIQSTIPRLLQIFKCLILHKMAIICQEQHLNIYQSKQITFNRISSFDNRKNQQAYLQEIQIVEYLANVNVSIRRSLKDKEFKSQMIIQLFQENGLYVQMIKGLIQSGIPYIRTLYLDFLKDSCDLLAKSVNSKDLLNVLVNLILQKLFLILKTQDITSIQQTIQEKKDPNLKNSMTRIRRMSIQISEQQKQRKLSKDPSASFLQSQNISPNDINIQSRYAQLIQMWTSVKFYTSFSICFNITNLPIVNLLSLILQSFPFSYLKYTQLTLSTTQSQQDLVDNYQLLQDQIKNVTGLKKEVLEIIDIIWGKFNQDILEFLVDRGDPRVLVHCNIDPIKVLSTIFRNRKLVQVLKYYRSAKLNLPKTTIHYNGQVLMKQNQICYFLYLYLMYCNFGLIKNRKLSGFLQQLMNILKVLRTSQHIQTKIWIFQLLHLLAQRILVGKQANIEGGGRIKQELQQTAKQTLDEMVKIIIKARNFTHKVEIKTGFISNLFTKQQKQVSNYDFVKMFPPTIFMISQTYMKKHKRNNPVLKKQLNKQIGYIAEQRIQNLSEDSVIENFLFSQWLNRNQTDFKEYLSICCIKTIIAIGNNLIINIFEKDLIKVASLIKQTILALLPICQDKSQSNQLSTQLISQYIYLTLSQKFLKPQILPLIRRPLILIYMGNDFFKCTKKNLFYWKQIIDACAYPDLLGELLAKEGLIQGLLKGKAEVLRQKIKSFQRICFVIYSGKVDKYQNRLRTVLEFLNQVMKQQNTSPALLILMLFCIRILFMRLSQSSLNKMFKSIWPGLIAILIQIFTSKLKNNKNINLILAALKVVELIHALQMQQFNFHKWIFIIDFFGIKIQPMLLSEQKGDQTEFESMSTQKKPQKCQPCHQILTPFIFKPYLTSLLPCHCFKCEFLPQSAPPISHRISSPQKQIRKLIVKQTNIQTIEQVQNLGFILMQYMIDCNQKRMEVSRTSIQQLIEADFINLDDYIFQIR